MALLGCGNRASQAEVDRLAERVDSFAVTLTAVTKALGSSAGQRSDAPDSASMSLTGAVFTEGRADALYTLVEFTDYQCPYCARHANEVLPLLRDSLVAAGILRWVLKDLPLVAIHPRAAAAALASRCVAAITPSAFIDYHDAVIGTPIELTDSLLRARAVAFSVDAPRFDACINDPLTREAMEANITEAGAVGMRGTPGFVLGRTTAGDTVRGKLLTGFHRYADFRAMVSAIK
ncbi:MAG: thioredoxin domain-containing protein [Gemmatimonadales bacterium]|nr:thioredoxin domain-containing protein [Gemmatimonadales bacterium]